MSAPITATPVAAARARNVTQTLHFTTNRGLIGTLSSGTVLSRAKLDANKTLEAIGFPNVFSRSQDAAWVDYVSMSVSRVNKRMLTSSQNWHLDEEIWWAVLAFDVSLIDDAGIFFATTNNIYPVVQRGEGVQGFEAMFAPVVPWGYYGSVRQRFTSTPDHHTTCPQAEVLYPEAVSLAALTAIYVPEPELLDNVAGVLAAIPRAPDVPVECKPEVFD